MIRHPEDVVLALVEDEKLVFKFFAIFSRFEYALKRTGFLRDQERAEADWDRYSTCLRGRFAVLGSLTFTDACAYLEQESPRQQVVDGTRLTWKACLRGNGESEESYVLRMVRTVRNNLFHGGKYPDPSGPVQEVARDRRLLGACITVLEECLRSSPEVRCAFEEVV